MLPRRIRAACLWLLVMAAGWPLLSSGQSVTNVVRGSLPGTNVWSGQVVVAGDVIIPTNSLLTIAAGAYVRVTNNASILALNGGTLIIAGAPTNKVVLIKYGAASNAWWRYVGAGGRGSVLQVRHAEISGGQTAAFTNCDAVIEESYLHDYFGGSSTLDKPLLVSNYARSVHVRRCHFNNYYEVLLRNGTALVEDSLFEHIEGDALDFDSVPPGTMVRRCTFRHGNLGNVDAVDVGNDNAAGTGSTNVLVESCVMWDFPFDKGVSIGDSGFSQGTTVSNCLIYGCESGIAVKDSCTATIVNCTLVGNTYGINLRAKFPATAPGIGGLATNVYHNIIWSNSIYQIWETNSSVISARYNDIQTNFPGVGNINANPAFRNAAQRDYRLLPGSPAIGAGEGGVTLGVHGPIGSSLVDTDGDGIPDPWEWNYGLEFYNPADAALDADGDGLTALQEFIAGTEPANASSVFRAEPLSAGSPVAVNFAAVADHSYTVQYRDDLVVGQWQRLVDIAAVSTNRTLSVSDPNSPAPGRFYRIVTPALP